MKKFFQKCSVMFLILSGFVFGGIIYAYEELPNTYNVYESQNLDLEMFPYYINSSQNDSIKSKGKPFSDIKFLNIFPVKSVCVNAEPKKYVLPCGAPFGAKIYTDGIIVIDNTRKNSKSNFWNTKKAQGEQTLQKGDVILKVNDQSITSTDQFENIINNSDGHDVKLTVMRQNKEIILPLTPTLGENGTNYAAGIWVRDSSAGIGTMTFFDPATKMFAGLGHGICDIDTGNMLSVFKGTVDNVSIVDLQKSMSGAPGELQGCFTGKRALGEIYSNGETGIYGKLDCDVSTNIPPMEIMAKQNIQTGAAQIITTIDGSTPHFYNINIDSVNYKVNSPTKNIKLTITDPELLEKTGGIVQGMSGSPIIQNQALVGAVTHVLVNDPTKGYGIFAETMLTNSNKISETHHKNKE